MTMAKAYTSLVREGLRPPPDRSSGAVQLTDAKGSNVIDINPRSDRTALGGREPVIRTLVCRLIQYNSRIRSCVRMTYSSEIPVRHTNTM